MVLVAGTVLSDETPEPPTVIRGFPVSEFVDDDIMDNLGRGHHESPIRTQHTGTRLKTPHRVR
jgi:hypothetical protein